MLFGKMLLHEISDVVSVDKTSLDEMSVDKM
jgi:hypothetical protein